MWRERGNEESIKFDRDTLNQDNMMMSQTQQVRGVRMWQNVACWHLNTNDETRAMDLAYMYVKPQNAFLCVSSVAPPKHQMRLYVCHQMRLYVCHQMRSYERHQIRSYVCQALPLPNTKCVHHVCHKCI